MTEGEIISLATAGFFFIFALHPKPIMLKATRQPHPYQLLGRNKNRCYIPEWLLEEWEIAVYPNLSGAA